MATMRSAPVTYLCTAITLVVCFTFVFAPYASAQQPSSAGIVGRWHSLETSNGGIGQIWELRSDGTADYSTGAVVTMPWRIENNQLVLPPATKDGPEQKYTLKWLGDNKVRWEIDGDGVAELERVGKRPDPGNPIVGEWMENREIGGRTLETRSVFYPRGEVLLLIPMSVQHGTYSTTGSALYLKQQGLTRQFKFKLAGNLLTVSASKGGQEFRLARY